MVMLQNCRIDYDFWAGKRVLVTGFTGFKGAWLWLWLERLGADLTGLALACDTVPGLADILQLHLRPGAIIGDIRDRQLVEDAVRRSNPQIVFHLAAQSLVRRSFAAPLETFDVNVQGTLILLEALRSASDLQAAVIATSDKVYCNERPGRRLAEHDRLGGNDPYSASKAACEIAVACFTRSFFGDHATSKGRIATARAGNVIGGGDWSADRLIPDVWRARRQNRPVHLRFPESTRPWQHVLDPLSGYLAYAQGLCDSLAVDALNFGPEAGSAELTAGALAQMFAAAYGADGTHAWQAADGQHPAEAKHLAIDSQKAMRLLGWRARLAQEEAVAWTADWYSAFDAGKDMVAFSTAQIERYEEILAQTMAHPA